jgi:hypothetical protein
VVVDVPQYTENAVGLFDAIEECIEFVRVAVAKRPLKPI